MSRVAMIALASAVVLVVVAVNGFFVVRPDQFAIVTEFGEPVDIIAEEHCADPGPDNQCFTKSYRPKPGLYFMVPFVQDVRYLDARVRGWDDSARDTKTVELRTIDFTAFARWRITDPLKFYTAARTEKRAMAGMDSIVTARIQAAVRENKLASIVRDRGRQFTARAALDLVGLVAPYQECRPKNNTVVSQIIEESETSAAARQLEKSADGKALRSEITNAIRAKANKKLQEEFGITIFDLHFKYLNYSPQVHQKMIESIRADRRRDIALYRKMGDTCVGAIDREKVRFKGEIVGDMERRVRELEGTAIAGAIRTKAQAFNRDPEFFRFLKTLELYENAMTRGTRLVLSSDSPLLSLMNDPTLLEAVGRRDLPTLPPPGTRAQPGNDPGASPLQPGASPLQPGASPLQPGADAPAGAPPAKPRVAPPAPPSKPRVVPPAPGAPPTP